MCATNQFSRTRSIEPEVEGDHVRRGLDDVEGQLRRLPGSQQGRCRHVAEIVARLEAARAAGLAWPLPTECDEEAPVALIGADATWPYAALLRPSMDSTVTLAWEVGVATGSPDFP